MFPEMCLSLALTNVHDPTEYVLSLLSVIQQAHGEHRSKWDRNALAELMHRWCFAEDLETCEHAGMEAARIILGAVRSNSSLKKKMGA